MFLLLLFELQGKAADLNVENLLIKRVKTLEYNSVFQTNIQFLSVNIAIIIHCRFNNLHCLQKLFNIFATLMLIKTLFVWFLQHCNETQTICEQQI